VPSKRKSFYIEKLKDILANRIRLSAFHMRADEMSRFLRTMVEFKPDYFYGYPSALSRFAQWIQEKGLSLHGLKLSVIISTGEVLYPCNASDRESIPVPRCQRIRHHRGRRAGF
jgi:phenylacetate-coenzyme A ligase PaaK-like adenylate-forming protein